MIVYKVERRILNILPVRESLYFDDKEGSKNKPPFAGDHLSSKTMAEKLEAVSKSIQKKARKV